MSSPILFVGERRSPRAMAMGVDWTHGRLSAKTLHQALRAIGLDPSEQLYVNLFRDPPSPLEVDPKALEKLTVHCLSGGPVIALGKKVTAYLERFGIQHVALVHPAARGSIRRTENYRAHVAATLLAGEAPSGVALPIDSFSPPIPTDGPEVRCRYFAVPCEESRQAR